MAAPGVNAARFADQEPTGVITAAALGRANAQAVLLDTPREVVAERARAGYEAAVKASGGDRAAFGRRGYEAALAAMQLTPAEFGALGGAGALLPLRAAAARCLTDPRANSLAVSPPRGLGRGSAATRRRCEARGGSRAPCA